MIQKGDTGLNLENIVGIARLDATEYKDVAYLYKDSADRIESLMLY